MRLALSSWMSDDCYAPAQIAERVREAGIRKAQLDFPCMATLAFLAGAFIALGAAFSAVAATDPTLGHGAGRVLAGLAFSLGLILVVVAGAELFTGNTLLVMAWASRQIATRRLLLCWTVVYLGNLAGAAATAGLFYGSRFWTAADGAVGATVVGIALRKVSLGFGEAFVSGVLCNVLVCLAVWLTFGARSVGDKILAILFPITAFVAMGLEHSVANMGYLPLGWMLSWEPSVLAAGGWTPGDLSTLSPAGCARNLVPVTLGNVVGGGLLVAGVYWSVYLRKGSCFPSGTPPPEGRGR